MNVLEIIRATIEGEEHLGDNLKKKCLDYLDNLKQENQQLKDNWSELKNWLEENWKQSQDIWFVKIINKMQELEKGKSE